MRSLVLGLAAGVALLSTDLGRVGRAAEDSSSAEEQEAAALQQKPLLIDIFAEWYLPCQFLACARFDDRVLQSQLAARTAANNAACGDYLSAMDLYRQAQNLLQNSQYTGEIFRAVASGHGETVFDRKQLLEAAENAMRAGDATVVMKVARTVIEMTGEGDDWSAHSRFIELAIQGTDESSDSEVQLFRSEVLPLYALHVEGNPERAVALQQSNLPDGWTQNPRLLNGYAWWCLQNGVDLERAVAFAHRGAALAAPGVERAMILDTAAELCHALGNNRRAIEASRRAIEEDPENRHYRKQLERFQALLAKEG